MHRFLFVYKSSYIDSINNSYVIASSIMEAHTKFLKNYSTHERPCIINIVDLGITKE